MSQQVLHHVSAQQGVGEAIHGRADGQPEHGKSGKERGEPKSGELRSPGLADSETIRAGRAAP